MKEITTTIYEAFDGTKFNEESDCHNYEFANSGVEAWDSKMEPLDYLSLFRIYYVYVPTKESIEILIDMCCDFIDEVVFGGMHDPGLYLYGENAQQFISFSDTINNLHKQECDLIRIRQTLLNDNKQSQ